MADDDEAVRLALAHVLRDEGFDVWEARDGAEVLDIFDVGTRLGVRPDLLVLDLMMPRVNGWQVLAMMERTEDLHDIPVIVITGFGGLMGLPPECRTLHKPFERDVLLQAVRELTGTGLSQGHRSGAGGMLPARASAWRHR